MQYMHCICMPHRPHLDSNALRTDCTTASVRFAFDSSPQSSPIFGIVAKPILHPTSPPMPSMLHEPQASSWGMHKRLLSCTITFMVLPYFLWVVCLETH
jgi:hypothetical protein